MGESSEEQMLHAPCLITQYDSYTKAREDSCVIMKGHDDDGEMTIMGMRTTPHHPYRFPIDRHLLGVGR